MVSNGHDKREVVNDYSYDEILEYSKAVSKVKSSHLRELFFCMRLSQCDDIKACEKYLDGLQSIDSVDDDMAYEDKIKKVADMLKNKKD